MSALGKAWEKAVEKRRMFLPAASATAMRIASSGTIGDLVTTWCSPSITRSPRTKMRTLKFPSLLIAKSIRVGTAFVPVGTARQVSRIPS